MVIYQIQKYYYDDGVKILNEWFFTEEQTADHAAEDLRKLKQEEILYLLSQKDDKGRPMYDEDSVMWEITGLRRREINIGDVWEKPDFFSYLDHIKDPWTDVTKWKEILA